jgi:glycosyltransferase involved in cell wall biosynthesis
VFILTSKFEGLPNVLLETIVLKKFIISSDCPTGPKEILLNGKGGLLFKVGNYNDLAKKILLYNKNKKKCKMMLNKSIKSINRFDYYKNLEKYLKLINLYL